MANWEFRRNSVYRESVQYTAVPIGPLSPMLEPHVDLFPEDAKNRRFTRFFPEWKFTNRTLRRCHWMSQVKDIRIHPHIILDDVLLRLCDVLLVLLSGIPEPPFRAHRPGVHERER